MTGQTNQQNKGTGKGKGKKLAGKKGNSQGVLPSNSQRKLPLLVQKAKEPQDEKGVTSICAAAALYVSSVMKSIAACQNSFADTFHNLGVLDVHGLPKTCLSNNKRRSSKGTSAKRIRLRRHSLERPPFAKTAEKVALAERTNRVQGDP